MTASGGRRLRPLAQLLVDAVVAPGGRSVDDALRAEPADRVEAAARSHRVLPSVARHVRDWDGLPADWSFARSADRAQVLRHLTALADLSVVGKSLDDAGVPWVVGKGPVAAGLLWPGVAMREYYDLDLYVPRTAFAAAVGAVEAAGSVAADRNWPLLAESRRAEVAFTAPGGTHLDLHWDIAVPPRLRAAFRTDLAGMVARRRAVPLSGSFTDGVPTFDAVDTALVIAFHAAQAGANRLVWLGDVRYAVAAAGFEWAELAERARAARCLLPVALVVDRADRVLGLEGTGYDDDGTGLRRAVGGPLGRLARAVDARHPFPGLPGDRHLGGNLYSGARASHTSSAASLVRHVTDSRRIERAVARGTDPGKALWDDVPDAAARAAYFAWVDSGAG